MNQTDEIEATEENEDELYEHHRFVIDKGEEPYRIDKFLTERIIMFPETEYRMLQMQDAYLSIINL